MVPFATGWPTRIVDRSLFRITRSPRIQRLYMLACASSCECCGWSDHKEVLELHHVNGNQKDGRRENLKMLCPNCHEVDHLLKGTGKYDPGRYERAKAVRNALGLPTVGSGLTRTALQQVMDGKVQ